MEKDLETIFLTTVEANKDRLFRICRSYSTDVDDAKDLFQEVLLNLWKSLPSFKQQSNINTWAYRITINVCLRAKQFSDKKQKHFVRLESMNFENIEDTIAPSENEKLFQTGYRRFTCSDNGCEHFTYWIHNCVGCRLCYR